MLGLNEGPNIQLIVRILDEIAGIPSTVDYMADAVGWCGRLNNESVRYQGGEICGNIYVGLIFRSRSL
jgi:hypothetical protein